ncbi:MAG: hypothetical protein ACFB8W_21110 [Elainellaceae cyanobacterium]
MLSNRQIVFSLVAIAIGVGSTAQPAKADGEFLPEPPNSPTTSNLSRGEESGVDSPAVNFSEVIAPPEAIALPETPETLETIDLPDALLAITAQLSAPEISPDFAAALRAMLEFRALPPGTIRYDGRTVPDPTEPRCWAQSSQQKIDLSAVCDPPINGEAINRVDVAES